MSVNPSLVHEVKSLASRIKGGKKFLRLVAEDIDDRVDKYEAACRLSRGSDKERAAHWASIAQVREHALKRTLKQLQDESYKPNQVKEYDDVEYDC